MTSDTLLQAGKQVVLNVVVGRIKRRDAARRQASKCISVRRRQCAM